MSQSVLIFLLLTLFSYAPMEDKTDGIAVHANGTHRQVMFPAEAGMPQPTSGIHYSDGGLQSVKNKITLTVKTNLLFDIAAAPNLEAEIGLGERWSINRELMFPWWVNKNNNSFAFQVFYWGGEVRYWFGDRHSRKALTGHFIGPYAGGGKYDLQLKKESGHQGKFMTAGISYGYALPVINDNFLLEFSLSVGYLHSGYKSYDVVECGTTLAYRHDGKYRWLGPTKAKISFAWILPFKAKTGRQ